MATQAGNQYERQPMRIQARPGSIAEARYALSSGLPGRPWPRPTAIAPGVDPDPLSDLIFHGGRTFPQMESQNIFLGGSASWTEQDVSSINKAIQIAMREPSLNNVIKQYFGRSRSLTCDMRPSIFQDGPRPISLDEAEVQRIVIERFANAGPGESGPESCLFNLILPAGTTLAIDGLSSLGGLGGFHGSVQAGGPGGERVTLYYSANVYSEILPNGTQNGIAVFNAPWKNVVATLYHELNEFRTDPDIVQAISEQNNDLLGWMSRDGREVGDQPILNLAQDQLRLIFQEVEAQGSDILVPVQFLYSNAVHGAEGPIRSPHA